MLFSNQRQALFQMWKTCKEEQNCLSPSLQQRISTSLALSHFIIYFLFKIINHKDKDFITFPLPEFFFRHHCGMSNSICQDQTESSEEDAYHYLNDDDADESQFIYVINAILSGTARLNVLLPTATILAFTIFAPLLTNDGECTSLSHVLMGFFIIFLAGSCIFFTFTDSFRTATGRLYYGVATLRGIWTFNGGRKKPLVPSDYRLRWADLFHASLSLIAFLTFAGSHSDVVACYYPALPRRITNTVPLVVGFVISILFVVFPSKRRGIGYPFLLQSDALYSRC